MGQFGRGQFIEWRASELMANGIDPVEAYEIANREADEYYEYVFRIRKERTIIMRNRAFDYYGDVCACCGENRKHLLCIDHIDGGGAEHRRRMRRGMTIYDWLYGHDYPEGFRTLCYNCNSSYGYFGYCPHNDEPIEPTSKALENRKRRLKAIELYGGECMTCGEVIYEFLTFHHSGGWEQYHSKRLTGSGLVSWLLKQEGCIVGIELLCYNCHMDIHRDRIFRHPTE